MRQRHLNDFAAHVFHLFDCGIQSLFNARSKSSGKVFFGKTEGQPGKTFAVGSFNRSFRRIRTFKRKTGGVFDVFS